MNFDEAGAHWPWWLGAIALGVVAIAHVLLVSAPLGVSGLFTRLVQLRAERDAARRGREFADAAAFEAALMEATTRAMASSGMSAAAVDCSAGGAAQLSLGGGRAEGSSSAASTAPLVSTRG